MLLNGENFRKISERDNYAFTANLSVSNTTGVGLFGFSGNGQQFKFDFQSGKIIDPESKYVSSYAPDEAFTLSGNVNKGFYDFYMNDLPVRLSGQKTDFKAQRFFTDSTGCSVDLGVVMTASGLDGIAITGVPDNFSEGDLITGKIVNTGSGASIDIYTGQISDSSFTGNFSIISLPTTVSGEGDIVLSGISGDNGIEYNIDLNFETSFGEAFASTQISGFGYYKWDEFGLFKTAIEDFETLPSGTGIISGGNYSAQKTGNFLATTISGSGNYFIPGSTAHASLEYVSGTTGNFSGMITGVNFSSSGSGYINDPILRITGGGGSGAEVSGLLSGGSITGLKVIKAGAGYTSVPILDADKRVALIELTDQGSGYLTPPEINLVGGGGSGASFYGVVEDGLLTEVNVTDQGSGYTGNPEVHITASNVSEINLLSSGCCYSSGTVIFEGGTGASHISATADPLFAFKVTGVEVISGGLGFGADISNYQFTGGTPIEPNNLASGEAKFNWQVTGVDVGDAGLINVGGVKYTNIEAVFTQGTGVNGVNATGTPIFPETITGYSPIDAGENYKLARLSEYQTPGVVIEGSGLGRHATGYAVLTGYKMSGVEIRYTGGFIVGGGNEPAHIHFANALGPGGNHATGQLLTGVNYMDPLTTEYTYSITGVNLTSGGYNYTGYPNITFRKTDGSLVSDPPSGSGVLISGTISGVNYISSGSGYTEGLPVSFTGGMPSRTGSGRLLTNYPYNTQTGLAGVRITNGGSGYTGLPTITFGYAGATDGRISSLPAGSGKLGSGYITGVHIYQQGGAYSVSPDFGIVPSGTFGQEGYNSNLNREESFTEPVFSVLTGSGAVSGFTLTSGGSGYTGAPTVTVSGDGSYGSGLAKIATGAVAEVTMAEGIVGVPIIGNYNKTFENTFNLFTGSGNAESGIIYYDFRENGAINAAKTKYSSDIVTFTGDQSVIDIEVVNNNYFDDSFMVAQLTWSGNGESTGITITGVR